MGGGRSEWLQFGSGRGGETQANPGDSSRLRRREMGQRAAAMDGRIPWLGLLGAGSREATAQSGCSLAQVAAAKRR